MKYIIILLVLLFSINSFAKDCEQLKGKYKIEVYKIKYQPIENKQCIKTLIEVIKEYEKDYYVIKNNLMCGKWEYKENGKELSIHQKLMMIGTNKFYGNVKFNFKNIKCNITLFVKFEKVIEV